MIFPTKSPKEVLRSGLRLSLAYLAVNLNLTLVLHMLFMWEITQPKLIIELLGKLNSLLNFWDNRLCFWGNSFLNLTYTDSVRDFSHWLVAASGLRWDQYVLLYKEFFTSLYGGLFYFLIGLFFGVGRSRLASWRVVRKEKVNS
ncbi:MAG: hypothetical protein GY835_12850 [bacterium]|nr:hypothetical protein [bacterium]